VTRRQGLAQLGPASPRAFAMPPPPVKIRLLCLIAVALAVAFAQPPTPWRAQAKALKAKGDAAGALATFEKAAQAEPGAADLRDEIGFLLAVQGRNGEAIARFREAIAIEARYPPAHYHLGVALWLKQDPDGAIPAMQEAAKLDPKNAGYRSRLAAMFSEVGHDDDALREAHAGVKLAPRAELWNLIGLIHQKKNALEAARDAFAKAVALKPADHDFRNNLGFVLVDLGMAEQGLAQFRAVLQREAGNRRALVNVGYAHLQKGDYDAALEQFRKLAGQFPNDAVVRYDLGLALKQKDRIDEAKQEFREALRLNPEMAEAYYTLGITAWQNGEFDETIDAMRNAVARQPAYAAAHYMLGTALKQKGELAEAAAALEEAIKLDAASPGPFNTLAQIRQGQGDREAASKLFAQAADAKRKLEAGQARRLGAMGPATRDLVLQKR
jgi:tetratricopeptide (TPR) repeat protein